MFTINYLVIHFFYYFFFFYFCEKMIQSFHFFLYWDLIFFQKFTRKEILFNHSQLLSQRKFQFSILSSFSNELFFGYILKPSNKNQESKKIFFFKLFNFLTPTQKKYFKWIIFVVKIFKIKNYSFFFNYLLQFFS